MAGTIIERPPRVSRVAGGARLPVVVLGALTVVVSLALARLAWAFLTEELDWRYVAEQSRIDTPWPYRLAGVWAGMEGSLLLFVGIAGAVGCIATRRAGPVARWAALITVGVLAAVNVVLASPFERLGVPAVRGFGMNPILEHPAMTVHPPMLYAGLASAFGAALVAADGRAWPGARRWHLATVGLLTLAMTLGAAWSYVEQGWGGYWAWDPVENTSLLVWFGALIALHAGPVAGPRAAVATALAPWCLAVLGAILVRSGITPSIHGFAEQPSVGWALLALALATTAGAVAVVGRTARAGGPPAEAGDPRLVTVVLVAAAALVVLVGTVLPVLSEVFGQRSSAVRGEFYSRTVGPVALVAVPFVAMRLRRRRSWSTAAHAGALVLIAGVGVSTFDRVESVPIAAGTTVEAAGLDVLNDGVEVGPGPQEGTDAVTASLRVDGHALRPALVVHPARGGRLAEVALRTGVFTDVQALLESAADDGGVIVTIHVRHGMWLVWLGAATVAVATIAPAARRRGGTRSRWPRSEFPTGSMGTRAGVQRKSS